MTKATVDWARSSSAATPGNRSAKAARERSAGADYEERDAA